MKKLVSLILLASLAASLLAACAPESVRDVPVKDLMAAVAANTDLSSKMTGQTAAQVKANFYVDPARGHDDFLMSLALLVEAAKQYTPKTAKGG